MIVCMFSRKRLPPESSDYRLTCPPPPAHALRSVQKIMGVELARPVLTVYSGDNIESESEQSTNAQKV